MSLRKERIPSVLSSFDLVSIAEVRAVI